MGAFEERDFCLDLLERCVVHVYQV
jgi:hypothetical protein